MQIGVCSLCSLSNSDTCLFWLYLILCIYYLGTPFQLKKDAATQDIEVSKGDELVGDTLRSTLVKVTAHICEGDYARDLDFACINVKGNSPSLEAVQEKLSVL